MSTLVRPWDTERRPRSRGGGLYGPPRDGQRGDGEGPPGGPSAQSDRRYYTGMMVALAGIVMLFTGFTSAYLVRRGLGSDWQAFHMPVIAWFNTVLLLISSACLERARHRVNDVRSLRFWWVVATLLGIGFLIGQGLLWQQLRQAGVFLSSNPSSSFFYVLTAAHGVHLLGGVVALLFLCGKLFRGMIRRVHVDVISVYWHFMDGLWVLLMLLFVVWR